jgi:hypothetical protein
MQTELKTYTYSVTGYEALSCASEEEFLRRFEAFLNKIRPNKGRKAKENSAKNLADLEAAKKNYKVN